VTNDKRTCLNDRYHQQQTNKKPGLNDQHNKQIKQTNQPASMKKINLKINK